MQGKSGENTLLSNVFEQKAASISPFNELLGIDGHASPLPRDFAHSRDFLRKPSFNF